VLLGSHFKTVFIPFPGILIADWHSLADPNDQPMDQWRSQEVFTMESVVPWKQAWMAKSPSAPVGISMGYPWTNLGFLPILVHG
jgi:hypothetical protein